MNNTEKAKRSVGAEGTTLSLLRNRRVAVVASTGGHLEQATRWADRLRLASDSIFVTFDNRQSRGLLEHRHHAFVPYVAPRDARGALRAIPRISDLLGQRSYAGVLTTGAGIALSAYVSAAVRGLPFHYIESVSRFRGPSLTGRILAGAPRVNMYTQHGGYSGRRWQLVESLLSDYSLVPSQAGGSQARKIFVTLGTIRPFRFDALVDAVLAATDRNDEIVWQLGETQRSGLPGEVHTTIGALDFDKHTLDADIVVTHAGVGSIMRLLDLGVSPVVVPRSRQRHEHVDDHQHEVASALSKLQLITKCEVTEITWGVLHEARPRISSGAQPGGSS